MTAGRSDRFVSSARAAIAHDMRSLLHGVVGGARTLAHQPALDDTQRQHLIGVVERQADLLEVMLEQLMDSAGPHEEVAIRKVDVGLLVAEVVEEYRAAGVERVHLASIAPDSYALADWVALRRCVVNLVDNGLTHAGVDSRVEVSVEVSGLRIRVSVSDDGPGIPADLQDAVFTRGRRGTDSGGGRGIGLHTVQRLTRAMGGEVSVATDARGTTFVVELDTA